MVMAIHEANWRPVKVLFGSYALAWMIGPILPTAAVLTILAGLGWVILENIFG